MSSGIEGASAAWHTLGWVPAFFSEIEKFPCDVLRHYYPGVPNHGDMHKFMEWPDESIDVLVGGTPCQSYSVAGLGEGLDDPRGNLTLVYAAVARRYRPRWLVWENVPGVLSNDGGLSFAGLLGLLSGRSVTVPSGGWKSAGVVPGIDIAYGLAWRVLDAQYFGLAQRRKRVFVVGRLGDWRRAAAVLFERNSMSGNPPTSRKARKDIAGTITGGAGERGAEEGERGNLIPEVAWCLQERDSKGTDSDTKEGHLIPIAYDLQQVTSPDNRSNPQPGDPCPTLNVGAPTIAFNGRMDPVPGDIPGALDTDSMTQCIAFSCKDSGNDAGAECSPTFRAMNHEDGNANAGGQVAVAIALRGRAAGSTAEMGGDQANALRASQGGGDKPYVMQTRGSNVGVDEHISGTIGSNASQASGSAPMTNSGAAVRRLTPMECERLQGFTDNFTRIPVRRYATKKVTKLRPDDMWEKVEGGWNLMAADGPRYRALGNSFPVPVIRWIGRRIEMVDAIVEEK